LKELGFKSFVIKINNRKVLSAILKHVGVKAKENDVLRVIDKLEKIGQSGVEKELLSLGLKKDEIKRIFEIILLKGKFEDVIKKMGFLEKFEEGKEGLQELQELFGYLENIIEERYFSLDLSLARGLDYYTSTIFEISSEDKGIGSIAGGGRYDKMIGKFAGGKEDIPAVGVALGIERIIEILKEKEEAKENVSKVFVANVSEKNKMDALKIAKKLRDNGINTEIDLMGRSLSKQLEYASKCKIPFALIVGDDEVKSNVYKLRDMDKGKEIKATLEQLCKMLSD